MTVILPTVDDFTETTVLTMIRKVVDYLCSDSGLVAQINNNDITGFTSSYTDNVLKIDATKGDGTTIPVCNLTIEGGSSSGNPYPTGISGTVGADGNITFTVTMSSGSPLTTTINMNYFASADDLSDLQEQVTGLKLTSSGNNMSINGTSAPIVNSISGSVINGNLKITVNGVESGDIPLPESDSAIELFPFHLTKSYNGSYHSTLNLRPGIQLRTKRIEDTDRIYIPSTIPQYFKIEGETGTYLGAYGTSYTFLIPCADIENEIKECLKNVDDGIYEIIAGVVYSRAVIFGDRHQNITISNHMIVGLEAIAIWAGTSTLDSNDIVCLTITNE